jgi:hypothetical protein
LGEWQYQAWLEAARWSGWDMPEPSYCHDCTPVYKEMMLAIGKCTKPETIFAYVSPNPGSDDMEPSLCGLAPDTFERLKNLKKIVDGPTPVPEPE